MGSTLQVSNALARQIHSTEVGIPLHSENLRGPYALDPSISALQVLKRKHLNLFQPSNPTPQASHLKHPEPP